MKAVLIISAKTYPKREAGAVIDFGKHFKDLAVLNVKGKGINDLSRKCGRIADIFMEKAGLDSSEYGWSFTTKYHKEFDGMGFATFGKNGLSGDYSMREEDILAAKKM